MVEVTRPRAASFLTVPKVQDEKGINLAFFILKIAVFSGLRT